ALPVGPASCRPAAVWLTPKWALAMSAGINPAPHPAVVLAFPVRTGFGLTRGAGFVPAGGRAAAPEGGLGHVGRDKPGPTPGGLSRRPALESPPGAARPCPGSSGLPRAGDAGRRARCRARSG